jgi:tetrahydromethanopterin S-methyltransferase subunit G
MDQEVHYAEAVRLLREAEDKQARLDKVSRGSAFERADLEQEIGSAIGRAQAHAVLAGIVLPPRTEDDAA